MVLLQLPAGLREVTTCRETKYWVYDIEQVGRDSCLRSRSSAFHSFPLYSPQQPSFARGVPQFSRRGAPAPILRNIQIIRNHKVLQAASNCRGMHKSLFQNSNLLHLTLGTMALLDDRERQLARDILEDCGQQVLR